MYRESKLTKAIRPASYYVEAIGDFV